MQGEQGPQGDQGIQGPAGPAGQDGTDGTSVTIKGSYENLDALSVAYPTGTMGDAYLVLGDLFVWNGSAWENVGTIQGQIGRAHV